MLRREFVVICLESFFYSCLWQEHLLACILLKHGSDKELHLVLLLQKGAELVVHVVLLLSEACQGLAGGTAVQLDVFQELAVVHGDGLGTRHQVVLREEVLVLIAHGHLGVVHCHEEVRLLDGASGLAFLILGEDLADGDLFGADVLSNDLKQRVQSLLIWVTWIGSPVALKCWFQANGFLLLHYPHIALGVLEVLYELLIVHFIYVSWGEVTLSY